MTGSSEIPQSALERFASVAAAYCSLVEDARAHSASEFLGRMHPILPRLYAAALELTSPDAAPRDGSDLDGDEEPPSGRLGADPDREGHDAWAGLHAELGRLLGDRCFYREVFDPYAPASSQPEATGDLADDFADLYGDLVHGLRKWRRAESREAWRAWRQGFESHWGKHLTSALRALFALSAWHDLIWPTPPNDDA